MAKGNYTITAKATPVLGEADTTDNTHIDGYVIAATVGDVDGNDIVEMKDIYAIALAYGCLQEQPCYKPNCDINNDGIIAIKRHTIRRHTLGRRGKVVEFRNFVLIS